MIPIDSPAVIIRSLLIMEGLGVDGQTSPNADWPIYQNFLPDAPGVKDDAIAVYDTAGVPDGRIMRSGETIEHQGIQVKTRCVDYTEGWNKMQAIATMFDEVASAGISIGSHYYRVEAINRKSVFSMGQEDAEKRRSFLALNVTVTLTQVN